MNYANIKYDDIANGPGVRTSLFVSGCTHACKGCFNEVAWDFKYGEEFSDETIEKIMASIEPDYISGMTILGGEPMEKVNQRGILPLIREFKKRFPFFEIQKELIINQYSINKNGIFIVKIDNFFIANLVTKEKYWQKPTYKTLEFSLLNLKKEFKSKKIPVNRLLMPKIGCGLDRLNWIKVKELLIKIFNDSNYEIIVCSI